MPFGLLFQCPHPPTHAGPVACRPSPLAAVAFASLPCVRSSAADAAPFLSPVAHARRRRNPAAAALNGPLRLVPRLRFGHPARPPLGHSLFSFSCTVVSFGALLVVSLCLAAVGCAYAYAFAFASGTASDSYRDWVPGCGP